MTLKEKFKKEEFSNCDYLEQVAEEFAIGFLEFTESTYSFGNVIGKWYLHADTSKDYTTKELLEIFKKEKGL